MLHPCSSESEQDEEADVHGGEEGAGHGGDGAEEGHADQGHGPGARRWGGRGQRGRGRGGAGGRHGHEREDSRGKTTRMLQKLTSKIQKGEWCGRCRPGQEQAVGEGLLHKQGELVWIDLLTFRPAAWACTRFNAVA